MTSNILKKVVWKLIGLIAFLAVIYVLRFLDVFIPGETYASFVDFINAHVAIIIVLGLIFLVGEIFMSLAFPVSLAGPMINGVGSILLVGFLFEIFRLTDTIFNENVFNIIQPLSIIAPIIVFLFVVVGEYIVLFARLGREQRELEKGETDTPKEKATWHMVGSEFKQSLVDAFSFRRKKVIKDKKKK